REPIRRRFLDLTDFPTIRSLERDNIERPSMPLTRVSGTGNSAQRRTSYWFAETNWVDHLKHVWFGPPLAQAWPTAGNNIMARNKSKGDVSIGKFDILATYVYARGRIDGLSDDEAKQRGMVAAIMGAQAKLGIRKEHHEDFQAQKEAAEKKN